MFNPKYIEGVIDLKSGEFTRTLECKIGRPFRPPAVRRRISVYYSTLYKEQLEKERLERIEKEKYPEKYSTLQERVCGWNEYFVKLSKVKQDMFIKQCEVL